jgi:hypothetical protein
MIYAILRINLSENWQGLKQDDEIWHVLACEDGKVKLFASLDEADNWREENAVDGRIIELPVY